MMRALLLLVALGFSLPAAAADLASARSLVDGQRYAEAIEQYEVLLTARPDDSDLLIEAARVNAWADRHPRSSTLYRRVLEVAPARRHDVLLPLAWQLAWDGRHSEAIPLFREVAGKQGPQQREALHGLAESLALSQQLEQALDVYRQLAAAGDDLKARKGEARILLWLDRSDEAAARYRDILASHPLDKEAQVGLARALDSGGRHLAASSQYSLLAADDPGLARDIRVERARSLRWAGLEDQALEVLGDAGGESASILRGRLMQETTSHLRAEFESSWDSDDLDVDALSLGWQQRFAGNTYLDVAARGSRLEQNAERIDGRQLLARLGTRLGDASNGLFWPALTLGVRDYDGWQTAAWKLQGKWIPADLWRVDLEAGNEVVENIESIRNEVSLDYLSVSADWRFAPRWSATLGVAGLRFDDGNRRTKLVGRIDRLVLARQPRLVLGIEGMGFNDSDPEIDRGYYNPERYRELKLAARGEYETAGWLLEGRLGLGHLWETPGVDSGLYAWELAASRNLDPMLRLRLYAGGSDSSTFLGAGEGYVRNYLGASLIWFF